MVFYFVALSIYIWNIPMVIKKISLENKVVLWLSNHNKL